MLVHVQGVQARLVHWVPMGVVQLATGLALHFFGVTLNTDLYSLSFLLLTGGTCYLVACICYYFVDCKSLGKLVWTPFMYLGMNAITMYLLAEGGILQWIASWFFWGGDPDRSLVNIFWPSGVYWGDANDDSNTEPRHDYATLGWTVGYISLWMLVATVMYHKKIFVVI